MNNSGNAYALATATSIGTSGNAYALSTATAVGTAGNAYATLVGTSGNVYATSVGVGANTYATSVGAAANTNAANATYLTVGTVPSARISGSYTGITGVGTLTAGSLGTGFSTVAVAQGGTGNTTFISNGVLFGNGTGAVQVTAAATEGNVLQANASGVPQFGMLDGGSF